VILRSLLSNVVIAACLFAQGPGSGNGPGKPNDPTADGIKRTGESIDADGSKTSFEVRSVQPQPQSFGLSLVFCGY
jgi:hypothetical protein